MSRKESDLEKIQKFLGENGIDLSFTTGEDNYIDWEEERIVISSQQPIKHITYSILHEIGHYFIDTHFNNETPTTQVIEEVLAWDCGFDIGVSLGIDIDREDWERLMEECVGEYIEKANDPLH